MVKIKGETKVAGVTFGERQGMLANLMKLENAHYKVYLTLRREKKNKNDSNAILVIGHCDVVHRHVPIGYVPKELAKELAPIMDAKQKIWVYEKKIGYHRFNSKRVLNCTFKYAYYKETV